MAILALDDPRPGQGGLGRVGEADRDAVVGRPAQPVGRMGTLDQVLGVEPVAVARPGDATHIMHRENPVRVHDVRHRCEERVEGSGRQHRSWRGAAEAGAAILADREPDRLLVRHVTAQRKADVIEEHARADEQRRARSHSGVVEIARRAELEQRLGCEAQQAHVLLRIEIGIDNVALVVGIARGEINAP